MANEELLGQLDRALADLKESFAGLSEEQAAQTALDQWCLKDVLAHISGWHYETAGMLDRMLRGERPAAPGVDYSNPDPWNERFVEERRGRSLVEALADLDTSFREMRSRAESLPPDRLEPGKTAYRLVADTNMNHYRDHGDQIRQWRQAAGI